MQIKTIYTDRYFQRWPSWDLVFEWEDIFKEHLKLNLTDSRKATITTKFIDRALSSLSRRLHLPHHKLLAIADSIIPKPKSLYFEMFPQSTFGFTASSNTIPIIIDFWKTQDLDLFYNTYKQCKLILISSKEAYDYLKVNDCKLNIVHFPLSISDKYRIDLTNVSDKRYDVILAGRTSPVLHSYLLEFEKKYPGIEYLIAKHIDNQLYYESNKTGIIGNFHKREDYINLLRSSKAALYSTPGIDGGQDRTGGFSPVTPRLFELATAGCSIIARYSENTDTDYFKLNSFFPSANDYSLFEQQLRAALNSDVKQVLDYNETFLSQHYTSKRIHLLNMILDRTN